MAVDARGIGRGLRAIRHAAGLSQSVVAARARVSQSVYSRAERGLIADLKVSTLDRIADSLGGSLVVDLRFAGGRIDRLIDRAHATLVEYIIRRLRAAGWETLVEFSFNVYGERGSVDILAWHAATRTLLIVEVKSRFTDLQAMLLSLSRKLRLVPGEVRRELGWDPVAVGRVVVVPGSKETRTILARHQSMFESTLPARTMAIRRWLKAPTGPISGMWLVSPVVVGREGGPTERPRRVESPQD